MVKEVALQGSPRQKYSKQNLQILAFIIKYSDSIGGTRRNVIKAYHAIFNDRLTPGRLANTYRGNGGDKQAFVDSNLPNLTGFAGEEPKLGISFADMLQVLDGAFGLPPTGRERMRKLLKKRTVEGDISEPEVEAPGSEPVIPAPPKPVTPREK